jgi:hypothetical protein
MESIFPSAYTDSTKAYHCFQQSSRAYSRPCSSAFRTGPRMREHVPWFRMDGNGILGNTGPHRRIRGNSDLQCNVGGNWSPWWKPKLSSSLSDEEWVWPGIEPTTSVVIGADVNFEHQSYHCATLDRPWISALMDTSSPLFGCSLSSSVSRKPDGVLLNEQAQCQERMGRPNQRKKDDTQFRDFPRS